MTARLEHANITVHDVDGVIRFLLTAFPEFRVRRDQTEKDGSRWVFRLGGHGLDRLGIGVAHAW